MKIFHPLQSLQGNRLNGYTLHLGLVSLPIYFIVSTSVLGFSDFHTPGEKIVASGIVITTRDNSDNITNVKLMAEDTDGYNIILNEIGKRLGKEMNNKWVEVTGILYKNGEDYWFEVESYIEIKECLTKIRGLLQERPHNLASKGESQTGSERR